MLRRGKQAPEADRILATVMFTDIVGSTELAARLGDARSRELLDDHQAAVARELARFGGRRVKTLGGCLARSTARRAPSAAIAEASRADGLDVRIGLDGGEVEGLDDGVAAIRAGA